jgi:hypothetical protein
MNSITRGACSSFASIALGLGAFAQNSAQINLMPLNNGGEGVFFLDGAQFFVTPGNPPNTGVPLPALVDGTTAVDGAQNEYIWRVYPKTVMHHPGLNTMEISSLHETFWSDDMTGAGGVLWDMFLASGAVGATPPFIQPVLDSTASLLYGAPSGFPVTTCPPPGNVNGYEFVTVFGGSMTATGNTGYIYGTDGLKVATADGTDASILCLGYIQPGGMTTIGGTCTFGNQSSMTYMSQNESQNDYHGGGFNEFAGLNEHDGGNAWPGNEVPLLANQGLTNSLGFFEPVLQPRGSGGTGLGIEHGLGTLNPQVSAADASYGYHLASFKDIGKFGVVASSFSTLTSPINVLGADIILNVAEPTVSATQRMGMIVKQNFDVHQGTYTLATANDNLNKGTFKSAVTPLPITTPSVTITMQGIVLTTTPVLAAEETNAVKVTFRL